MVRLGHDDVWTVEVDVSGGLGTGPRRRRRAVELRRIVEEPLKAGAFVARVALKYGVNANQVFQWCRLHRDGKLGASSLSGMKLLPVNVVEDQKPPKAEPQEAIRPRCGAIHIELPSEIRVSLEGDVDPGRGDNVKVLCSMVMDSAYWRSGLNEAVSYGLGRAVVPSL